MSWPVVFTWSAMADEWSLLARALKCSTSWTRSFHCATTSRSFMSQQVLFFRLFWLHLTTTTSDLLSKPRLWRSRNAIQAIFPNQDWLRRQLKNIFYGYIYSYDFSKQKRILSKDEWAVLSDFRNNDSIIISKPDKGNGVVIDSRLDYLTKMKKLISDGTKFKQLKQNPTKSREENLSVYLRKLKKDGIIDDVTSPRFYPVDLLLVFCTVCQRFTKLDALSAPLFLLWALIITILLPT